MIRIPRRAPIAYDDLRRQYNTVRGVGAAAAAIMGVAMAISMSAPVFAALAGLAAAVAVDAWARRAGHGSALGSLAVDTCVIGLVMYARGPAPAVHALAIMALLLTGALLLPARQAALVVACATAWAIAISTLGTAELPGFAAISEAELGVPADRVVAVLVIGVSTALLFRAVQVILSAQDRQREALARERRAVELKNEFVSMVSHELRTPLTGITGFTETLDNHWESLSQGEIAEFLAIMRDEAEHLSNLVEDILVIPRLEAGRLPLHMEHLELAPECHAVASMVFADTDYSVSVPSNVVVDADRMRLRQILRNLLENARKYGGDQVLIDGELHGPGLYTVSVSDNGSGIGPDDRERIFEHFEQLSSGDARLQQGVGLGLPIARRLARAMGGDLWYEDRFPVGSRFSFTLPIADGAGPNRDSARMTHATS